MTDLKLARIWVSLSLSTTYLLVTQRYAEWNRDRVDHTRTCDLLWDISNRAEIPKSESEAILENAPPEDGSRVRRRESCSLQLKSRFGNAQRNVEADF